MDGDNSLKLGRMTRHKAGSLSNLRGFRRSRTKKNKSWGIPSLMRMEVGIRRAFTLLEIMIALALLCILGTVTAVQVKKMVDRHRFEAEVAGLFSALQEAQVLSATYQTDLALDIE